MKTEIEDFESGTDIYLIPETAEESALLLRLTTQTKAEKPNIYLTFYKTKPLRCNIWLRKKSESVQINQLINK